MIGILRRIGGGSVSALLALLSAAAVASPTATAPDQSAIRAFLTRLLAAYVTNRDPPPWTRAFTPDMQRLIALNERLNNGEESEALGADPVCGCQDWRTIRVRSIALARLPDHRVTATVRITNFGPDTRVFVMARTAAGWRIDDVLEDGSYGLRRALLRDNARLQSGPNSPL